MESTKNLDQQRARDALEKVRDLEEWNRQSDYRNYLDDLPATIVRNGLGQAAATLLARADGDDADQSAHRRLHDHLEEWLCGGFEGAPYAGEFELVEAITENDQDTYVRAQSESLAWLKWAKKFARAYLDDDGGRDE